VVNSAVRSLRKGHKDFTNHSSICPKFAESMIVFNPVLLSVSIERMSQLRRYPCILPSWRPGDVLDFIWDPTVCPRAAFSTSTNGLESAKTNAIHAEKREFGHALGNCCFVLTTC
jgi:hypothetical protein